MVVLVGRQRAGALLLVSVVLGGLVNSGSAAALVFTSKHWPALPPPLLKHCPPFHCPCAHFPFQQVGVSSFTGYGGCGSGEPSAAVNVAAYARWIRRGVEVRAAADIRVLCWLLLLISSRPGCGAGHRAGNVCAPSACLALPTNSVRPLLW